jgi:alkanesulfonate monooxygenase SsuD/methylene tetrahydromethanopterin reductase-like flavin-dependent oxidoreductase (luciferase family)
VSKTKGIDEMTRDEIEQLLHKLSDTLHLSSPFASRQGGSLSQAMENLADLLQNYETISGDPDEVANRIAEAIKMVGQARFSRPDEGTVH